MKLTLGQKILQFPLTRIVIAIIAIFLAIIGRDIVMGFFPKSLLPIDYTPQVWLGKIQKLNFVPNFASVLYSVIAFILLTSLVYLMYLLYVRKVEKRELEELNGKKCFSELSLGIVIGSILLLTVIGILFLFGHLKILENNFTFTILPYFMIAATAAFMEELIFRGIIFRILEEKLGTWITLIFTAALFGGLHGANPGATLFSILTIAVSAGLLLGSAYVLTRRLWLPIGMHFAVNAIQGGVFGTNVSGLSSRGIYISKVSGNTLLTGGDFGIESSVIVLVLGIILSIVLLFRANSSGKIIKPFFMNKTDKAFT